MKHHAKLAAHTDQIAFVHVSDVLVINHHGTRVWLEQSDDVLEQNTFATAAASDDDKRFALLDLERHSIEDRLRAKTFFKVANFDHMM